MRAFGRSAHSNARAAWGAVGTLACLLSADPARAQWGQTSPHTLELNGTFWFGGDKSHHAKAPDCKTWQEAMRDFEAMREAGVAVTTIKGTKPAISFVEHAYRGKVSGVEYQDLESVIVETIGTDRFRVFTGNEPKGVVCGFDRPQYLDKRWFEAGLYGRDIPFEQTPPSPLDPLRSAYRWQSYSLVRPSLLQRGYSAFEIPETVAQRCAPATERLCQEFPEAVCNSELLDGITCTFVFRREGTGQLVGIDASVERLTAYTAHIVVTDVREVEAPAK